MVPVPPLATVAEVSDAGVVQLQIVWLDPIPPAVTIGLTVMVLVAVLVQLFASVPVTVYTMLLAGDAITDDPFVADNEVDGAHVQVLPPLAANVFVMPDVKAIEVGFTVTVGKGLTVTAIELVYTIASTDVLAPRL